MMALSCGSFCRGHSQIGVFKFLFLLSFCFPSLLWFCFISTQIGCEHWKQMSTLTRASSSVSQLQPATRLNHLEYAAPHNTPTACTCELGEESGRHSAVENLTTTALHAFTKIEGDIRDRQGPIPDGQPLSCTEGCCRRASNSWAWWRLWADASCMQMQGYEQGRGKWSRAADEWGRGESVKDRRAGKRRAVKGRARTRQLVKGWQVRTQRQRQGLTERKKTSGQGTTKDETRGGHGATGSENATAP